jgi:hypothetical protein
VHYRLAAGLPALLAEPYVADARLRQTGVAVTADMLVELIGLEYQGRWQRGERAARQEYLDRFPEHAEALRALQPRCLTPQERFQLILAAGARGDEAEQARLANAGGRVRLSLQDHAPYALAFGELNLISFIDLLENAADYLDAIHQADDAEMIGGGEPAEEREDGGAGDTGTEDAGEAAAERAAPTVAGQLLCLALAKGFTLKADLHQLPAEP